MPEIFTKQHELINMKTYRVYYLDEKEEIHKDIKAENLFELVQLLETKYLYKKQYNSIYKIEVI